MDFYCKYAFVFALKVAFAVQTYFWNINIF